MYSTSQRDTRPGRFLWPILILSSALAAVAVSLLDAPPLVRAPLVGWFLLVCPGMAFVRLLRIQNGLALWTLAIALSFALSILVPTLMLYANLWSPNGTLVILAAASIAGALLDVVGPRFGAK